MLYFVIWCYVFARCVIFCYIHPYRTAASAICLPTHRPPASMAAILGREPKDLSTKEPKHRHENMAGPRQTCRNFRDTKLKQCGAANGMKSKRDYQTRKTLKNKPEHKTLELGMP